MKKSKKLLLFIGIPVAVILILFAAFFVYISQVHFIHDNFNAYLQVENQDRDKLEQDGYEVNYPRFRNATTIFNTSHIPVYAALVDPVSVYAHNVVNDYKNYAKLDYTVKHEGDTLTIAFTGFGYPDEGKGEPVSLDKTFVFDVKNVSDENPPKLISQ